MIKPWTNVECLTDDYGAVVIPELTDVAICSLAYHVNSLSLEVKRFRSSQVETYRFTCGGIVALKIDNVTMNNVTMNFYCSTNGRQLSESIYSSLRDELRRLGLPDDDVRDRIQKGSIVLFGNEPSDGCEIAVLCTAVALEKCDEGST